MPRPLLYQQIRQQAKGTYHIYMASDVDAETAKQMEEAAYELFEKLKHAPDDEDAQRQQLLSCKPLIGSMVKIEKDWNDRAELIEQRTEAHRLNRLLLNYLITT